jgi:hypothetical protein
MHLCQHVPEQEATIHYERSWDGAGHDARIHAAPLQGLQQSGDWTDVLTGVKLLLTPSTSRCIIVDVTDAPIPKVWTDSITAM